MKKLIRFGFPGGLEFFLNLLAFDILVLLLQSYGPDVAASVTIAFNWDMVSFVPLIGINIGVISLSGRYSGAKEPKLVIRSAYSGLKLAIIYGAFIALLYSVFPEPFVSLFLLSSNNSGNISPLAEYMVRMVAIYVIFDGFNLVFSGALKGTGDTFKTMIISVIFHWSLAAESFFLVKVIHVDPKISWTAFVFTIPVIAAAFFLRFRSGQWKKIKVVDEEDAVS